MYSIAPCGALSDQQAWEMQVLPIIGMKELHHTSSLHTITILWIHHTVTNINEVTLLLMTLVHDCIEGDSVGDVHLEQVHGLPVGI